MGKHDAPQLWAICRACGRSGNVTRAPAGRRLRCSRCGGFDYSLTVNDPAKPIRSAQRDSGEVAAHVRLPPAPAIDADAWERGTYP